MTEYYFFLRALVIFIFFPFAQHDIKTVYIAIQVEIIIDTHCTTRLRKPRPPQNPAFATEDGS